MVESNADDEDVEMEDNGGNSASSNALANDDFFEGDPFQDAEEEYGQEVGEEDILDAGEWAGEGGALEEEAPPIVPVQRRSQQPRPTVKLAAQLPPRSQVIAKAERPDHSSAVRRAVSDELAGWELFKVQKLSQANVRDTGAKAICRIKLGLRQPGAQADGRPCIPEDWDTAFKPTLGSFKKFILGRPDQFHIISGAEPGLFILEIVSNETVVAPSLESKGKGKGKKGLEKGKGKFDSKGGKGKDKANGKGKPWGSKGGTDWTDSKPWASAAAPVALAGSPPAPGGPRRAPPPPTRAARLLTAAAKDALAEEEEAGDFWAAPEVGVEDEMGEDEWLLEQDEDGDAPGAPIDDPIERLWQASPDEAKPEEEEEEANTPAERPVQHGRFMSLLGGLGGKRPGSLGAAGPLKKRVA